LVGGVSEAPAFTQGGVELFTEQVGQLARLPCLVEGDGFSDIIDDDLAGVAPGHMLFESVAEGGVQRSIDVFVQPAQEIVAFHGLLVRFIEP
jgi:hypothetical protein